jgi:ABC-2 type transport system ATP-binding protein
MDDLVNLAKRVIVISEGMIIFDGNLLELISRFANEKIIKIYTNDTVDYQKLEKMGRVLKVELPEIVIAVPRQNVQLVAAHVLSAFSVDDMTIEEEPVDSVIRKVFGSTHKKKKKIK